MSRATTLAVAAMLATVPLGAQPRPVMSSVKHARATLQPVALTATSATVLVTLAVDDGWHVSWRNPGETGLPTRFTWSLPDGVRVRRDTWPVPVVTRDAVGVAHTLEGDVPWLIEFVLDTPAAADRLVTLTLRYGICRDVCIPEQQVVQGVLPGTGAGASPLSAVPKPMQARLVTDGATVPARLRGAMRLCLDRLPAAVAGPSVDMIAGPDRALDAAMGVVPEARAAGGPAHVRLPASGRFRQPVDTVLLVSGTRGVSVPLDFRAPAPRCR